MSGTGFDQELIGRYTAAFPVEPMREFLEGIGFDIRAYVDRYAEQVDALETARAPSCARGSPVSPPTSTASCYG